jgi:hypothetical protein
LHVSMRRIAFLLLVACGERSEPARPLETPTVQTVPVDASPSRPDAVVGIPTWHGCCSGGSWVCSRAPEGVDCAALVEDCYLAVPKDTCRLTAPASGE